MFLLIQVCWWYLKFNFVLIVFYYISLILLSNLFFVHYGIYYGNQQVRKYLCIQNSLVVCSCVVIYHLLLFIVRLVPQTPKKEFLRLCTSTMCIYILQHPSVTLKTIATQIPQYIAEYVLFVCYLIKYCCPSFSHLICTYVSLINFGNVKQM